MMFNVTVALSLAVVLAFGLSAWSLYSSHQQACNARNTSLNVLRDVVVIATTPPSGQKVTADEQAEISSLRHQVDVRINAARCH
jgi:hypothetical protein